MGHLLWICRMAREKDTFCNGIPLSRVSWNQQKAFTWVCSYVEFAHETSKSSDSCINKNLKNIHITAHISNSSQKVILKKKKMQHNMHCTNDTGYETLHPLINYGVPVEQLDRKALHIAFWWELLHNLVQMLLKSLLLTQVNFKFLQILQISKCVSKLLNTMVGVLSSNIHGFFKLFFFKKKKKKKKKERTEGFLYLL